MSVFSGAVKRRMVGHGEVRRDLAWHRGVRQGKGYNVAVCTF